MSLTVDERLHLAEARKALEEMLVQSEIDAKRHDKSTPIYSYEWGKVVAWRYALGLLSSAFVRNA